MCWRRHWVADKRPLCKNCGTRHGLAEPHAGVQRNVTHSSNVTLCAGCAAKDSEIVTLRAELDALKRANSARQKAYRERRGSSNGRAVAP